MLFGKGQFVMQDGRFSRRDAGCRSPVRDVEMVAPNPQRILSAGRTALWPRRTGEPMFDSCLGLRQLISIRRRRPLQLSQRRLGGARRDGHLFRPLAMASEFASSLCGRRSAHPGLLTSFRDTLRVSRPRRLLLVGDLQPELFLLVTFPRRVHFSVSFARARSSRCLAIINRAEN